jgi:hypothetical protein
MQGLYAITETMSNYRQQYKNVPKPPARPGGGGGAGPGGDSLFNAARGPTFNDASRALQQRHASSALFHAAYGLTN